MSYLAFYRMFRPATFKEVVRQEHIVRILKNQIASDKVGHAYLFCGPRGTGKTTLAKIFARAINCLNPQNGSPCGECEVCKSLKSGADLDICEIDAASNNGVDEMRDLREKVQYPPVNGRYNVYIIDEVHMLTTSAFNAVLKTLEEPPRHAVFILATTEPQKIPATILSRCMRFDFKLIPQSDLKELVKSVLTKTGKEFEEQAVAAIARAGAGSARDSLSIADMCASYSRGKLTYSDVNAVLGATEYAKVADICGAILKEDALCALERTEDILSSGKSVGVLIKDMLAFLNNAVIVKTCATARKILNVPEEEYALLESAAKADGHKLLRVSEVLSAAETALRYSTNGKITLETAVFKCAMPQSDYNIDALIGKINALEQQLKDLKSNGVVVQAQEKRSENKTVEPVKEEYIPVQKPEKPVEKVEEKKSALIEDSANSPFTEKPETSKAVQPVLWEEAAAMPHGGSLSNDDKRTFFAKFIKCLRTTHKNAVLFTLCMDLQSEFEGDKLIFQTDSEAVYKALSKTETAKFLSDVLLELGVTEYELKVKPKGESEYETALRELKKNFDETDIEMK